jgi:hypothetical protein
MQQLQQLDHEQNEADGKHRLLIEMKRRTQLVETVQIAVTAVDADFDVVEVDVDDVVDVVLAVFVLAISSTHRARHRSHTAKNRTADLPSL